MKNTVYVTIIGGYGRTGAHIAEGDVTVERSTVVLQNIPVLL
jgi:alpha-D-ribose 1-methylphosphonate 5-triphosphate synthase subunit PhnG